jgi:hypothetical protein
MGHLKVLELQENHPLSEVEALLDKFYADSKEAGVGIDVEMIEHFEHTFHKTHGVILYYHSHRVIVPEKKEPVAEVLGETAPVRSKEQVKADFKAAKAQERQEAKEEDALDQAAEDKKEDAEEAKRK